ncbi:hypothetical protein L6164_037885 [Bauhinia variegata]|uniref:Uncharacterized protein n=3 Tax=Bauhinia variegata TaxID=167791 RepID=A0ACB9KLH1_BAUVA|nr:hypothetical protein L6164_037783 [Bauhinia variegata]KAI4297976.1 hypothetical protein L6164_037830 [Bauhinia variegata]KAI4298033.1 hypothetical protein L6164_037885 [Bauhinia variegata]
MPPPKNLKELRGLLGRLQFIRRFFSKHSERCEPERKPRSPIHIHMGRRLPDKAFDSIKCYLINAPILSPPVPGRPLRLYISTTENALGAILAQHDDEGKKGILLPHIVLHRL